MYLFANVYIKRLPIRGCSWDPQATASSTHRRVTCGQGKMSKFLENSAVRDRTLSAHPFGPLGTIPLHDMSSKYLGPDLPVWGYTLRTKILVTKILVKIEKWAKMRLKFSRLTVKMDKICPKSTYF